MNLSLELDFSNYSKQTNPNPNPSFIFNANRIFPCILIRTTNSSERKAIIVASLRKLLRNYPCHYFSAMCPSRCNPNPNPSSFPMKIAFSHVLNNSKRKAVTDNFLRKSLKSYHQHQISGKTSSRHYPNPNAIPNPNLIFIFNANGLFTYILLWIIKNSEQKAVNGLS